MYNEPSPDLQLKTGPALTQPPECPQQLLLESNSELNVCKNLNLRA